MPHLLEILIATSPADPMLPQPSVRAVPNCGLVGDRYFLGTGTFSPHPQKPDFEITLIQQEHIQSFVERTGIPFTARDARRNLVTTGIDLNTLVGCVFQVGTVKLRGIRLCEPCNYLVKQTHPEVLQGLVHQGGLRAQILTEGDIRIGDPITCDKNVPLPA